MDGRGLPASDDAVGARDRALAVHTWRVADQCFACGDARGGLVCLYSLLRAPPAASHSGGGAAGGGAGGGGGERGAVPALVRGLDEAVVRLRIAHELLEASEANRHAAFAEAERARALVQAEGGNSARKARACLCVADVVVRMQLADAAGSSRRAAALDAAFMYLDYALRVSKGARLWKEHLYFLFARARITIAHTPDKSPLPPLELAENTLRSAMPDCPLRARILAAIMLCRAQLLLLYHVRSGATAGTRVLAMCCASLVDGAEELLCADAAPGDSSQSSDGAAAADDGLACGLRLHAAALRALLLTVVGRVVDAAAQIPHLSAAVAASAERPGQYRPMCGDAAQALLLLLSAEVKRCCDRPSAAEALLTEAGPHIERIRDAVVAAKLQLDRQQLLFLCTLHHSPAVAVQALQRFHRIVHRAPHLHPLGLVLERVLAAALAASVERPDVAIAHLSAATQMKSAALLREHCMLVSAFVYARERDALGMRAVLAQLQPLAAIAADAHGPPRDECAPNSGSAVFDAVFGALCGAAAVDAGDLRSGECL